MGAYREPLSQFEKNIIENKGTEMPFTGKYYGNKDQGIYLCRKCRLPLFDSSSKFDSGTGWPSFDSAIKNAVVQLADADGRRTEIVCACCQGHLGHLFIGEGFTCTDKRNCVNSASLLFVPCNSDNIEIAYFASGCFWGTQHVLAPHEGVITTSTGYMGGNDNIKPNYNTVCSGATGHAETVQIVFDNSKISFEKLAMIFFETHDPTQLDRQGPDIGSQYRSAVFYTTELQKKITESLVQLLIRKSYPVATELSEAAVFWPAEEYHQDYYIKTGKTPYCHYLQPKF
jgi:peptide methionine sulfoxide reductase msrA/msrB